MNSVTRYYIVRYYDNGRILADSEVEEVGSPDPRKVVWGNCYAFYIYQQDCIVDEHGVEFKGQPKNSSKLYYHPDSYIESLEQVKLNPMATRILISNMSSNNWQQIIWNRYGRWPQPYDPLKSEILT